MLVTEIIRPGDPRWNSPEFLKAKKKEIKGLIEKGTRKVVLKEDIPKDANVLNGSFVLTIKNVNKNEEIFKARYVVQGHKDNWKNFLTHNSTNMRQSSSQLMMVIASTFDFRVWSHDRKQAYLQSSEQILRKVYLKPSKYFELAPNQLL